MTHDYTLLTGATGLLGRFLLRDLLTAGHRVAVIARASKKETIQQRIEAILQRWETPDDPLPRPVCLEGDIRQERLGLDSASREWVAAHCQSLIHSAAVLIFDEDDQGEPWRSNVGGTENALALCEALGIRHLHYVSTAYVCGLREDRVFENQLDVGQEFRNDYERSKLAAEKRAREADFLETLTVYRPAVIAGDSATGYTNTYHGLYLYLKLMSILVHNTEPGPDGVRYTPVRLEMTGDEPRNVVPVDWVSKVICRLYGNPDARGRTFHLAPLQPITPREIIEAGYTYFHSRGVEFGLRKDQGATRISDMDRDAHQNMTIYKSYDDSDPPFDTTNLREFTPDLPCPSVDQAMLHRYWRYGEEDRWGKRRERLASIPFSVDAYLRRVVEGDQRQLLAEIVGLDVTGPGGGQWSLLPNGDQLQLRPGVTPGRGHLLRLTAREFAELADQEKAPAADARGPRIARYLEPGDGQLAERLAEVLFPH